MQKKEEKYKYRLTVKIILGYNLEKVLSYRFISWRTHYE